MGLAPILKKDSWSSFTRVLEHEAVSLEHVVGLVLVEVDEEEEGLEVAQVHGVHRAPHPVDQ